MTRTAGWESNNTLQCLEQHQAHLLLALGDYAPGTPVAYATFVDKQIYVCTVLYYRTYCSVLVRTYCTILNCTVLYCTVLYCTARISSINFCSPLVHSIPIRKKQTVSQLLNGILAFPSIVLNFLRRLLQYCRCQRLRC